MDINPNVVNEELTTLEPSQGTQQVVPQTGSPLAAPGSKTPSELLLESLQQEREKVRRLEAEINNSNPVNPTDQTLQKDIEILKEKLAKREMLEAKQAVIDANPVLKDKTKEFDEFLANPENKGMSIKTAARAFITENGLNEVQRPGLERKTGGDRQSVSTGMTIEEADNLRISNFRLYQEKLIKGEIPNS